MLTCHTVQVTCVKCLQALLEKGKETSLQGEELRSEMVPVGLSWRGLRGMHDPAIAANLQFIGHMMRRRMLRRTTPW